MKAVYAFLWALFAPFSSRIMWGMSPWTLIPVKSEYPFLSASGGSATTGARIG